MIKNWHCIPLYFRRRKNSENVENTENPEIKKEVVPVDKEESISLKENNEVPKEKKNLKDFIIIKIMKIIKKMKIQVIKK